MKLKDYIDSVINNVPENVTVEFDIGVIETQGNIEVYMNSLNRIKFSVKGTLK